MPEHDRRINYLWLGLTFAKKQKSDARRGIAEAMMRGKFKTLKSLEKRASATDACIIRDIILIITNDLYK